MKKQIMVLFLIMYSMLQSSEVPQPTAKPLSCIYNPYSLSKITSLQIINYLGQESTTIKKQVMNSQKTCPELLNYITKVAIEHNVPDDVLKKIEFYFSRLSARSLKRIAQEKVLWSRIAAAMTSNEYLPTITYSSELKETEVRETYEDIRGQKVYETECNRHECIIPGKKKIYVFHLNKVQTQPNLVDATSFVINQDEINHPMTAGALHTYYDVTTKTFKRTVIFGTDDGTIWLHRTGPKGILSAPLKLTITKIVYDLSSDKSEISKIGLIARDSEGNLCAYISTVDDHPPEQGKWFKGSSIWTIPVEGIENLAFKSNYLVAYTATSWSAWTIKKDQNEYQLCQASMCNERDLTDEEGSYQSPRAGTQAGVQGKTDYTPVPAFAEQVG